MPSAIIRNQVRFAWPAKMPGVRYVDTLNRTLPYNPPLPLPDVWGTLAFDTQQRRQVTMGSNPWVEERGVVTIIICARSGHGDGPGVQAATDAMHMWDGWAAPGGQIWFTNIGAPQHLEVEAKGEWFLFGVPCDYTAQERIALPDNVAGFTLTAQAGLFTAATP